MGNRRIREDVAALRTATMTITLGEGQYFCELDKSWELWGPWAPGGLPKRIKRWPERRILWIFLK